MLVDSGMIQNIGLVFEGLVDIFNSGKDLISVLPEWLNPIQMVSDAFKGLAIMLAGVADYIDMIRGLFTLDFNTVGTALGLNIGSGQMSHVQKIIRSGSEYVTYNAAGNDNWRGGLTWVGEAGPELVSLPRGSQIYSAQDSRNMGGGQVININVNGIQQLDEIVSWYESRRVRGRMA